MTTINQIELAKITPPTHPLFNPIMPASWLNFLERVCAIDATALIMGGCIRDNYTGRPARDIDIFVSEEVYRQVLFAFEPDVTSSTNGGRSTGPDIVESWTHHVDGLPPINFVVCHTGILPLERMKTFDFGACQVATSLTHYYYTDQFVADTRSHHFTLLRCRNERELKASLKRYRKWRARFEGWGLRIAPDLNLSFLDTWELPSKPAEVDDGLAF